jgi:hypothetical protein
MNAAELSRIVNSLIDRPLHFMTDQQLALWLKACREMEHSARPAKVRRHWMANRLDAEAESLRRAKIDAEAREYSQLLPHSPGYAV